MTVGDSTAFACLSSFWVFAYNIFHQDYKTCHSRGLPAILSLRRRREMADERRMLRPRRRGALPRIVVVFRSLRLPPWVVERVTAPTTTTTCPNAWRKV